MEKYLKKKAIKSPWKFDRIPYKNEYSYIIVIPSFNEGNQIISTLVSISKQKSIKFNSLLVIIVVNNSINPSKEIFNENQKTIDSINNSDFDFEIRIIDAYKNYPLPQKHAGVGLARKIGFDLSLKFTDSHSILIALDADTIIDQNYLQMYHNS